MKRPSAKKFMATFLLCMAVVVMIHEGTHGVIMEYYGCENVTYGVSQVAFYTNCTDDGAGWTDSETLAHSVNEVVGYNIAPWLALIVVLVMFR